MKNVVVTEKIHQDGIDLLQARVDINLTWLDGDMAQIKAALALADGVLVRTVVLGASELSLAKNLQIVSRHGVGCDNIDVDHLSERGIPMAIAATANSTSVVEHVMMMLLYLTKRGAQYDRLTRNGAFHERGKHHTSELCGKHILIVGYGRIGKKLAPVCKAFGMRVTVADIALDRAHAEAIGCQAVQDFRPCLAQADFVSLHVPLDNSTRNLVDAPELKVMQPHAMLINCARGGIVNERALADAIRGGTIAATGADVFSTEPPAADNPLLSLSLPNSVYTPHNAATTAEGFRRMATEAAQNILDCFDGKLTPQYMFNAVDLGL